MLGSALARRPGMTWVQPTINFLSDVAAMLERVPTAYNERIYGPEWRAWTDPAVPEELAPTTLLLDRHLGTPIEHKPAVIVDGEATTYGALAKRVAEVSAGRR